MCRVPAQLQELSTIESRLERRLRFVAILSRRLSERGECPIVVGGHAVEIHSLGEYTTGDIDLLVSSKEPAIELLESWGFQSQGRIWWHPRLDLVVDLIAEPLAGSRERTLTLEIEGDELLVIGLEDLIVDRLNGCVHWQVEADCQWVRLLLRQHSAELDEEYLYRCCAEAGTEEKLTDIRQQIQDAQDD